MRKILMMLAAILCCAMMVTAFSACTNGSDDNPTNSKTGRAVITINPAPLYDELDMTDSIVSYLSKGNILITDTVLIYNEKGVLVSKLGTEVNTLQPFSIQTDDLPNGTYTLLVWQTVRGNVSGIRGWIANDEEQLSTVNITTKYESMVSTWVVGIASTTITADGNIINATVAPKSMGSIVEMQVDGNTEDKGYTNLNLYVLNDWVYGFHLDPSCTDENRWLVNSDKYYAAVFAHLSSGNNHNKFFTLNRGDNMTLSLWDSGNNGFTYIANIEHAKLHAGEHKVYYLNLDCLSYQPPFFGATDTFTTWKSDRDKGILVFDPCLKWGCNSDEVQQHVQAKSWWLDKSKKEHDNVLMQYYNVANNLYEVYIYDTGNGESLRWVYCLCNDPNVTIETANASLLKQGYVYKGKIKFPDQDYTRDIYFSADGANEVQVIPCEDNKWEYLYQPTDPNDFQYIITE